MTDGKPPSKRAWLTGVAIAVLAIGAASIGALLPSDDEDLAVPTTVSAPGSTSAPESTTTSIGYEPFTLTGTGDETVEFHAPDDLASVLHIVHEGQSQFSVTTLDGEGDPIEVLVETEGDYDGSRAINLVLGDVISSISVVADGDWSITATYLGQLERSTGEAAGSGDDVVLMDIADPSMTITHDGEGDFSVFMWTFENQGYVVKETGPVDTTVSVPLGGAVIEIEADGDWRLSTTG